MGPVRIMEFSTFFSPDGGLALFVNDLDGFLNLFVTLDIGIMKGEQSISE